MKKIKLKESDLQNIIRKVISEKQILNEQTYGPHWSSRCVPQQAALVAAGYGATPMAAHTACCSKFNVGSNPPYPCSSYAQHGDINCCNYGWPPLKCYRCKGIKAGGGLQTKWHYTSGPTCPAGWQDTPPSCTPIIKTPVGPSKNFVGPKPQSKMTGGSCAGRTCTGDAGDDCGGGCVCDGKGLCTSASGSRTDSESRRREMGEGIHSPYGEKKDQWGSNKDEYDRYMRGGVKHKAGVVGGKKYGKGGHYKTYINKKGRNAKLKHSKHASKHVTMKESELINLIKRTVNESALLNEQLTTTWCSNCMQSHPPNYCAASGRPCNANFDKDSLSCSACEALFPSYQSSAMNTHCHQQGQPCYTSVTQWKSPGKGWAQAPQDIQAKKGNPNRGGGKDDTIRIKESQLTRIIDNIVRKRR